MSIWIDGDACPKAIKQILFRAAIKRGVLVTMVANHYAMIPASPFIKRVIVTAGFDKADSYIVDHLQSKELVITSDIILADHVIAKQAYALNPRGTLYSANNIKQILSIRNLNESLRDNGLIGGGADKLSNKEIQNFSNQLDRFISNMSK
ncbi:YaiI/YqxD family protein [Legionella sp. CNM-1927-20]|uniref:YaiI/YqxD family protein n=1 Tax=Legionella sp. CNM-1927-20 TaxID=3422221 RepID=UPI00403B0E06